VVRQLHLHECGGNTQLGGNAMRKSITTATLAPLFVAALAAAQGSGQPQNPPAQTPQTPQPTAGTAQQPTTTLVGCLYREDQIPGRKPNVAERAGILEDYILADVSTANRQTRPDAAGTTGTAGTAVASGAMYKVEGPSDEKLKALVGKRVEVTGRIDPEAISGGAPATTTKDRSLGPDAINLPEFEATAVREISGTCPATPAPRK
jgi:hypothetical protein